MASVAMFMHYGRWPELQRWVTASSLAMGVSMGASNGFAVTALIDAEHPVPRQVWATPAEIAPSQRAVYAVTTWHRAPLLQGTAFLALAWFWAPDFSSSWQPPTMAAILGVFLILQARTRLRVDGRGVEVSLPWLGGLRRTLPYDAVQFASARPRGPGMGPGGLIGGGKGWGYVSGRGPVLALRLTDGREFLYSTRTADTAAALVNASLACVRGAAGC
ncbi:hypothetical protein [Microbispora catharanthi]|uniref:DUF1648 domain-containing protein n=1 Tax=Microbispora catharanthi TaxID=1712871 RepID=A0A5N6BTJ4_9ACTN|nr:hypothetical protein [Microbispora catharanthi]KAB8183752.1 hypothetical protein FH610_019025 [Microbispora catharanthi]